MVGKSEAISTPTITSWVFTIPCSMEPALFVGFYFTPIFFRPLIVFFGWMVHVNSINSPFHIVHGSPIPVFSISINLIPWFIYSQGFNIVYSLSITFVGVPYFSVVVGAGLGYVTSSYLICCKEISFFFYNLNKLVVSAMFLASLWSILVHSFSDTMLF